MIVILQVTAWKNTSANGEEESSHQCLRSEIYPFGSPRVSYHVSPT